MPNQRPSSENFDNVTPLGLAVIYYLLQLHKQYPGVLAQFALGTHLDRVRNKATKENKNAPQKYMVIDGVPCAYHIHERLFNVDFSVNRVPFQFTESLYHNTNLNQAPEALMQPITETAHQAALAIANREPANDIISKLQDIVKATTTVQLSLQDKTWSGMLPYELINAEVQKSKEDLQEVIDVILTIKPIYTTENIEKILNLRRNLADRILPTNWREAINGLLTKGYQDMPADASVQAKAHLAIAGALLFKLNPILRNKENPLPGGLWAFISKIGRSTHDTASEVIAEEFENFRCNFRAAYKDLHEDNLNEKNSPADIERHLSNLRTNLPRIIEDRTFKSFHSLALHLLFDKLDLFHELVLTHAKDQLPTFRDIITAFFTAQEAYLKTHADIIRRATDFFTPLQSETKDASPVLSRFKHPKKAMHAASLQKKLIAANEKAAEKEAQQKAEVEAEVKHYEASMKLALKKKKAFEDFVELSRRASQEKEDEDREKEQAKLKLSARRVNSDYLPKIAAERSSLHRGLSSFFSKVTLPRAASHDSPNATPSSTLDDTIIEESKTHSPRHSPRLIRKKKQRSPEVSRKQGSRASQEESSRSSISPPIEPKSKKRKQWKTFDPALEQAPPVTRGYVSTNTGALFSNTIDDNKQTIPATQAPQIGMKQ